MKKFILKMMTQYKRDIGTKSIIAIVLFCSSSCAQKYENKAVYSEQKVMSTVEEKSSVVEKNKTYKDVISSSIATTNVKGRKLIKTSEIKGKVKDVFEATQRIESSVNVSKGFVILSELKSSIDYTTTMKISKDSSATVDYVKRFATLEFRVPSNNLDSCLRSIAPLFTFLNYRNIRANDVTLSILGNELIQKRNDRYTNHLDSKMVNENNLESITEAENELYTKNEQSDLAVTSNLALEDQIKFSTVVIDIYEDRFQQLNRFKDSSIVIEYEEPFFTLLIENIAFGWNGLKVFFLFVASVWEVIILLVIAGFVVNRLMKRFSK